MKKRIIIPQSGPIFPKGGVYGPIETPYMEDVHTISVLLLNNYKVVEVLEDGTKVPLTLQNFDKDNSVKVETVQETKEESVKKVEAKNTQYYSKDKKNNNFKKDKYVEKKQETVEPAVDVLEEK